MSIPSVQLPSPPPAFLVLPLSLLARMFIYFLISKKLLLTFCSLSILSFSLLETSAVFAYAKVFNSDLSEWNVAKATSMENSTCHFPLFNSPLHHLLFFFFLSPCSNVDLFFNIKKNCFLRLIVLFLFSLSLFETSAVFFNAEVFNSDLSEWNVAKVTSMQSSTCQFPLFNSPLPTTFLFFSSDIYKQFFVSFTPTIMLNLVLPPPCSSFISCLILQCLVLRKNST